jgi:hypothetical protein
VTLYVETLASDAAAWRPRPADTVRMYRPRWLAAGWGWMPTPAETVSRRMRAAVSDVTGWTARLAESDSLIGVT